MITLIQGDCLEKMKDIADGSIDLTVTSPPYDNLRTYNGYTFDFEGIAKELYRVTKQGGVVVWIVGDATINGSETGTSFKQALYFKDCGFNLHDTMIWQKISPYTNKNRYISCFEYMFIFSKGAKNKANLICDRKNKHAGVQVHGTSRHYNGKMQSLSCKQKAKTIKEYGSRYNIWEINPANKRGELHPAVFPEQLAHDHIISWSNEGDTVLDCFLGSGTTGKMAKQLNRNFIGIEISPEYLKIAESRIND